ncbi:hypothetical protein ILUMI_00692 [Ignelater luminosus]|uniref:Uncharacterized protein n=1 Tax=Ignelater luminosus TaxID=2038154 RepID=A0A8K0DGQ9_IGNLU|nr:hypothetical protein ILUMI_00692 [Ignelater luminosus]
MVSMELPRSILCQEVKDEMISNLMKARIASMFAFSKMDWLPSSTLWPAEMIDRSENISALHRDITMQLVVLSAARNGICVEFYEENNIQIVPKAMNPPNLDGRELEASSAQSGGSRVAAQQWRSENSGGRLSWVKEKLEWKANATPVERREAS